MFYSLYELLNNYDIPGARLMSYISFRSGVALVLSLFIAIVFGRRIINRLLNRSRIIRYPISNCAII